MVCSRRSISTNAQNTTVDANSNRIALTPTPPLVLFETGRDGPALTCLAEKNKKRDQNKEKYRTAGWAGRDSGCIISRREGTLQL